jgi:hypothetical protein
MKATKKNIFPILCLFGHFQNNNKKTQVELPFFKYIYCLIKTVHGLG